MTRSILAILVAAALARCAAPAPQPPKTWTAARLTVQPMECAPDDELDDRACIQAALDAVCADGGGAVHLKTGTWLLTRPASIPGSSDNASLWLRCSDLALTGEGPGTLLLMTGDGYGADWSGVRVISGERISISDLTIASDQATNLNEQTHLLHLQALAGTQTPIKNVQLHRLRLRHPVRPEVAGDCLRLVGDPGAIVSWVDASHLTLEACDRSGIAMQRGVEDFAFNDIDLIDIGKSAVDFEPSGTVPIQRGRMVGLNVQQGGVSICGQNAIHTTDITLASSIVRGGVGLVYADRVTLTGNWIGEVGTSSEGALRIAGSSEVVAIGNTIRRLAGSTSGPAVKVGGVSGVFPGRIVLSGGSIASAVEGHVVDMESVQDMTISGVEVTGLGASSAGINARATGRDVAALSITGNRIRGPLGYAVRIAGNPSLVVGALVALNYATGPTFGFRCENPAKFTAPVVHGGNYYSSSTAVSGCTGVVVAGQVP